MNKITNPKTLKGIVTSTKMNKTVVVRVERLVKHPLYGKYLRRHKKYLVHDAEGKCREGEVVTIRETRPISRRVSFIIV